MKNTEYHEQWQKNRIQFLIDTYGNFFLRIKRF